eukprot:17661-Heterococcus_DN1.PRE.3
MVRADHLWLIAQQNTALRGQLGLEERRSITSTAKADKLQSDYAALESRMSTTNAAYKAAEQTQQSLSSELHALRSEGRRRLDECSDEASKLRQSLLHAQAELHSCSLYFVDAHHTRVLFAQHEFHAVVMFVRVTSLVIRPSQCSTDMALLQSERADRAVLDATAAKGSLTAALARHADELSVINEQYCLKLQEEAHRVYANEKKTPSAIATALSEIAAAWNKGYHDVAHTTTATTTNNGAAKEAS